MSKIFRFKQFEVDQTGCAMKINTDGVLLGAMLDADSPGNILDIGTGTGVIALMLAQRYTDAIIDAVDIDEIAAQTAEGNFKASPFASRLTIYPSGFESFFEEFIGMKYAVIVSNPPFYINSLKSPKAKTTLAKHTDSDFFERLMKAVAANLIAAGTCWLIIPVNLLELVINLAIGVNLHPQKVYHIRSYPDSEAHRVIVCFGFDEILAETSKLTIYKSVGIYSDEYQKLLQPYFIAF